MGEIPGLSGSLPPREAWIEMHEVRLMRREYVSLPPREAWIEIVTTLYKKVSIYVASPAGSVD